MKFVNYTGLHIDGEGGWGHEGCWATGRHRIGPSRKDFKIFVVQ